MSKAGHTAAIFSHNEASQTNAPTPNDNNTSTSNPTHTPQEKISSNPTSVGKIQARRDQASESTTPSTPEDSRSTRQVIAVSASKGPAAFFNLSRKFLVTDEEVDLSALEGAIVSAVDAAHLLERSKLATIVRYVVVFAVCQGVAPCILHPSHPFIVDCHRVQTSYVAVEPKRRKAPRQPESPSSTDPVASEPSTPPSFPQESPNLRSAVGQSGRELRRSRIIITMRRTPSYKQWLEDNPLQAMAAGGEEAEEDDDDDLVVEERTIEEAHHTTL